MRLARGKWGQMKAPQRRMGDELHPDIGTKITRRWTLNRTFSRLCHLNVPFNVHMNPLLSPKDLGKRIRAERKARGRSQAWIAERVGCRRQTIADLEAGRNVALNILMGALAALGKGLAVVDARVDLERLTEMFDDSPEEN